MSNIWSEACVHHVNDVCVFSEVIQNPSRNMASVQAHSIEYLKYKRKIDKKKYVSVQENRRANNDFLVHYRRRSLMNLRNHSRRIEEMFWDNDSTALFQIRLHGKFAAKLLKKFHKYNELEKTEILSLHSVMERYFVDIEQRHAEFTLKRLVLYVKLDQILRRTVSDSHSVEKLIETNGIVLF